MNLSSRTRPQTAGDVIPMINVAFLLLIFFLVLARLAPPDPLDISPPLADLSDQPGSRVLSIDATGRTAFAGLTGDAATLAAATGEDVLTIRADAALDATVFAGIVTRLAAMGAGEMQIVTVQK